MRAESGEAAKLLETIWDSVRTMVVEHYAENERLWKAVESY